MESYDSVGRRAFKKVTVEGTVTLHQRYIYRRFLQIASIDLTRSHHPCMWLLTWDPSQPIATRPLAIQLNGTWYTYGWDLTKNVCELFGSSGYISSAYSYSPYGSVLESGSTSQPIKWNSEFFDNETRLSYYNYRYYNYIEGNWISRDNINASREMMNLYRFALNNPVKMVDLLGKATCPFVIEIEIEDTIGLIDDIDSMVTCDMLVDSKKNGNSAFKISNNVTSDSGSDNRLKYIFDFISGTTDKSNRTFSAKFFLRVTNAKITKASESKIAAKASLPGELITAELNLDTGTNVAEDVPFFIHAIIEVSGALDENSGELKYKVIKNFGPRIHPNKAYTNPHFYQRSIQLKIKNNR